LTLAQRINRIFGLIERENNWFPLTNQYSCIICKNIRLDPDPTGLTCGDTKCLAELGKRVERSNEIGEEKEYLQEKVVEIAKLLGVETIEKKKEETVPEKTRDIKDILSGVFSELNAILDIVKERE